MRIGKVAPVTAIEFVTSLGYMSVWGADSHLKSLGFLILHVIFMSELYLHVEYDSKVR